jgi:hypothetical protein
MSHCDALNRTVARGMHSMELGIIERRGRTDLVRSFFSDVKPDRCLDDRREEEPGSTGSGQIAEQMSPGVREYALRMQMATRMLRRREEVR